MTRPDWIAVDWGTSHLRAWAMDADDTVLDRASSDDGMGSLEPDEFEPALLRLIGSWLGQDKMPVFACGMVGSRQGWAEAPYRKVPCKPAEAEPVSVSTKDPRLSLRILPGISQDKPADVMRGEETQVAGVMHEFPGFDGVICLPGTHTKWIHVSAGEVVSFQTAMTGELFSLLTKNSVLRHSTGGGDLDRDAFEAGVDDMLSHPARLSRELFGIRAASLLHGQGAAAARGRLSGLLIGAELAAAKPYWLGQDVLVGGAEALVAHYAHALGMQGVPVRTSDAETLTLGGLRLARSAAKEATK